MVETVRYVRLPAQSHFSFWARQPSSRLVIFFFFFSKRSSATKQWGNSKLNDRPGTFQHSRTEKGKRKVNTRKPNRHRGHRAGRQKKKKKKRVRRNAVDAATNERERARKRVKGWKTRAAGSSAPNSKKEKNEPKIKDEADPEETHLYGIDAFAGVHPTPFLSEAVPTAAGQQRICGFNNINKGTPLGKETPVRNGRWWWWCS